MKKEHWALVSLSVNLLQSGAKLLAGVFTGSLSMLGESFHSLSDSFASLIAYLTLKFSDRKSQKFPYGLYKLENIGSISIAIFLFIASYEILQRAFKQEVIIKEDYLALGIGVVLFSLFSSLILSFLERRAGKRLNSPVLVADSYHTLTDTFGSSLVLMSFLSSYMGYQVDRYFAMGVSALIAYTALGIVKREVSVLLDISVDEKTLDHIRQVILSFEEVIEIRHLFVRSSGGKLFADITLVVSGRDFLRIHSLVDNIEERLKSEVPHLELVFIHYEPAQSFKASFGVLVDQEGNVSESFEKTKAVLVFKEGEKPELIKDLPKKEEDMAKALMEMGVSIIICGQHPESSRAKWVISKYGGFVWETDQKNPYLALSEVAYNFTDVKTADKERQDNRPFPEA